MSIIYKRPNNIRSSKSSLFFIWPWLKAAFFVIKWMIQIEILTKSSMQYVETIRVMLVALTTFWDRLWTLASMKCAKKVSCLIPVTWLASNCWKAFVSLRWVSMAPWFARCLNTGEWRIAVILAISYSIWSSARYWARRMMTALKTLIMAMTLKRLLICPISPWKKDRPGNSSVCCRGKKFPGYDCFFLYSSCSSRCSIKASRFVSSVSFSTRAFSHSSM